MEGKITFSKSQQLNWILFIICFIDFFAVAELIQSSHPPEEKKKDVTCWYYWKGLGTSVSEGVHGGTIGPVPCNFYKGYQYTNDEGMICELTSEAHELNK